MESRELVHITDGDIVEWVKKDGDSMVNVLNKDFDINQSDNIQKGNKTQNLDIWLFNKTSDLENKKQNDLWQAYQYNFENNLPLEANVQILEKF